MTSSKRFDTSIRKIGYGALFLVVLLLTTVSLVRSQEDRGIETIDATASGTSTQLGTQVNIKITIRQYSTEEDRQVLVAAFKQARIRAWWTRYPRCRPSAALPSTARWATTWLTFA